MKRATRFGGALALLFGVSAMVYGDEAKGTIKNVDTARNEVVVKGVVKDSVYELNNDATVWLDGARAKLADLKADDRIVVLYEKKGEHMMASSVRGLRNTQETRGTVSDVLGDKREVTLKGTIKNTTYELIKSGTVWIVGKTGALTDIRQGDEVLITYEQRGDHLLARDVTVTKRK